MTRASHRRSSTRAALLGTLVLASAAGVACSSESEPSPAGAGAPSAGMGIGGSLARAGSGGAPTAGSAPAPAGSTSGAGSAAGGSVNATAGQGGSSPSAGAPSGGQSTGGGAGGSGGASNGGSAGSNTSGGASPSGGANAGGAAAGSPSGGSAGSNAGGSSGATGGSAPDIDCPAGATFCSGFEGTALPNGTKFHAVGPNAPDPYTFDATGAFAGQKSLSIPMSSGGFYYRALAVPIPGQNFWVRLYLRVSRAFGDDGHDSLFGASTGNLDADVNNEALVEFSEQFGQVLLNTDDQLSTPAMKTTLEADKWHCVEAHYDGASGDVQVFANGKEIINAPGYAKRTFQSFRLGYMQYHDTRAVWFDDVIVAPTRVNCK